MFEANKVFRSAVLAALLCQFAVSHAVSAELIDGEELRDPTRPFASSEPPATASLIDAIMSQPFRVTFIRSGSQPLAVINNITVHIGDRISGAEVLAITPDGVTLRINGEERLFNNKNGSIKRQIR